MRSVLFSKCLTRHLVLEHRLRQQLLQARVLDLQGLQALRVRDVHPAEIAAPQIEARVRKAMPTTQLFDWHSAVGFLQKADDLLLAKPLLHVQPPPRGSDSKPFRYSKSAGRRRTPSKELSKGMRPDGPRGRPITECDRKSGALQQIGSPCSQGTK